ncbi:hypothetical protein ABK040_005176 [Willaertia magna]
MNNNPTTSTFNNNTNNNNNPSTNKNNINYDNDKPIIRPPPLIPFLEGTETTKEQMEKQLQIKKTIEIISESCLSKTLMVGVVGAGLGGAFGLISTSFALESTFLKTPEQILREEQMTSKEKIREYFKETKNRCVSMGKSFGAVGALYTIVECSLEKFRAKKDLKGSMIAGCVAGGLLASRAGPKAAVFGCATFSAFSLAIDWFTDY